MKPNQILCGKAHCDGGYILCSNDTKCPYQRYCGKNKRWEQDGTAAKCNMFSAKKMMQRQD